MCQVCDPCTPPVPCPSPRLSLVFKDWGRRLRGRFEFNILTDSLRWLCGVVRLGNRRALSPPTRAGRVRFHTNVTRWERGGKLSWTELLVCAHSWWGVPLATCMSSGLAPTPHQSRHLLARGTNFAAASLTQRRVGERSRRGRRRVRWACRCWARRRRRQQQQRRVPRNPPQAAGG
jgi:hypothetical protein